MKPKPFSHSYGESNFHIVFSPKYRHDVLRGRIAKVCDLAFEQAGQVWNFRIVTKRINPDHIHQFVSLRPNQSPSHLLLLNQTNRIITGSQVDPKGMLEQQGHYRKMLTKQ